MLIIDPRKRPSPADDDITVIMDSCCARVSSPDAGDVPRECSVCGRWKWGF